MGLAALSVAALCCSVLAARLLAELVEGAGAPPTAFERGIDRTPTATIPTRASAKLNPCGERAK